MRSRSGIALLFALSTACASAQTAQAPVPLTPGQRVRVVLSSRVAVGELQGTVFSISPDTLAVEREEGGIRRLSRSQVASIDVSVGRERDPARAARYGILAGAPLLILAILFAPIVAGESGTSAFGVILVPVAAVAALGAAIGSGAQDLWVDAFWPSEPAEPSASPDSAAPGL